MRVLALVIYLYAGNPHAEVAWVKSYEACEAKRPEVVEMAKAAGAVLIRFECIRQPM